MNTTIKFNTSFWKIIGLACFVIATASSCSKSDSPKIEPEEEVTTVPYYTVQRVKNLAAESDDANPTENRKTVLFNLRTGKEAPLDYSRTSRWDISFGGLYNSFVGGNNGSNDANVGFGGPGKGGVYIVEKAFDEVVDVPADHLFKTHSHVIGTDNAGVFGEGTGWYLYDFAGDILGNGSSEKAHVAYTLSAPVTTKQGKLVPARTLIIRLPNGDYAKIKILSVYKDLLNPDQWFRTSPKMFFTFDYTLVPAGSSKFTKLDESIHLTVKQSTHSDQCMRSLHV